ncbi:MAG: hypothetical protein ACLQVW_04695, partial [Limisphaerales bacterium]
LGYQSLEGSYASCAPDPERISWRVELHNIALTVTVIFARLLTFSKVLRINDRIFGGHVF